MHLPNLVPDLARAVAAAGGHALLVGGCVRDHLLGRPSKDLDVEVHGLDPATLRAALRPLGRAKAVGQSFEVFKLRAGELELDVSAAPAGVTLREACRRRDLTINAIAYDPLKGEYIDFFGGREDLAAGALREVDPETFAADPLRALRVAQFAGRFGFAVAPSLAAVCRRLDLRGLPGERVGVEVEKLLLKSPRPSVGVEVGFDLGVWPQVLPALAGVSGEALDRAAQVCAELGDHPRPLALLLAALLQGCDAAAAEDCLDRLKVYTSGGYPLRKRVLHAISAWPSLARPLAGGALDEALKWAAEEGEVALTARLAWAITGEGAPYQALARAAELGISDRPLPPILQGRDLQLAGVPPGPHMREMLQEVRVAQLQGKLASKEAALALALRRWTAPENG